MSKLYFIQLKLYGFCESHFPKTADIAWCSQIANKIEQALALKR